MIEMMGVGAGRVKKEVELALLLFCLSDQYYSCTKACLCLSYSDRAALGLDQPPAAGSHVFL